MKTLLLALALFVALSAHASTPDCLNGAYDMGARAAVVVFECLNDPGAPPAHIYFCKRDTMMNEGRCTGLGYTVACDWRETAWHCADDSAGFSADVSRLSETTIHYVFKSSFNDGDLVGTRFSAP